MTQNIKPPYCLFLGDATDPKAIKTAAGVFEWAPELVACEWALPGCTMSSGAPRAETLAEAVDTYGAKTLVVGVVTNTGGALPDSWRSVFTGALTAGLDVASGMHDKITDDDRLVYHAQAEGRELIDFRYPPKYYTIGKGKPRQGLRLLTVGQDCNIGKKYTAMALHRLCKKLGVVSSFRPTGQTGALIVEPGGRSVVLDTTPADFVSGAVEWLAPENADPGHFDIIEGQGCIMNPSCGQVSVGLLFGAQPDLLVMCVDPTRDKLRGLDYSPILLKNDIDLNLQFASRTNPRVKLAAISVNTSGISSYSQRVEAFDMYSDMAIRYDAKLIEPDKPSTMQSLVKRMVDMAINARMNAAPCGGE